MKKSIYLKGIDKELILSKVASIDVDKKFIHIEEMPDGTWRLNYSSNLIPDISKIESFEIRREK